MQKKTEVRSFEVSYICDKCNDGEMIFTGITLTSYPPQYQHKCEKCFSIQNFKIAYPTVTYEPLGFGQSDMIGPIKRPSP